MCGNILKTGQFFLDVWWSQPGDQSRLELIPEGYKVAYVCMFLSVCLSVCLEPTTSTMIYERL
jgi:hypothetical protein